MFKTIIHSAVLLAFLTSVMQESRAQAREDSEAQLVSAKYKLKDIYAGNVADPQILPGDRITVKH